MDTVTFTDEEIRVLKELASGQFSGTDPTTCKDLVLRGYVMPEGETLKITYTGRIALAQFMKMP